ncbi:chemotaxis response regulator protein-glutamate methylesterase [Roseibium sp. CAU 1637]|uniref:Protein-glutamate methylesterase/protein-glutamine glutaminase n=1 Tax=Roseibium limicola TaxID=2816037 RepID=A0A939EPU5_9HYPH|nr:chemotaxis response regulator protein-glutamate methylesterase [Roseibium limicola]MBO0346541.1 chemotaxis response regulator protein-glutamate methylesterase [Roseibium limicola]
MAQPIRVLIVDDSALVRQMLSEMLSADPQIDVIGSASDPLFARAMIKDLNPDVLTLDVEMPRMDGLNFLEKIMTLRPMPVVMVSSLTQRGADAALRAMELGAVEIVAKPTIGLKESFPILQAELIAKVKAAAGARVRARGKGGNTASQKLASAHYQTTERVVCIGASTGGVEALADVLRMLPGASPAIAITQHMPANFTAKFAARLDGICAIRIAEAKGGERMLPGHAYLAPGNQHLKIDRSGANYVCRLAGNELVSGHCPSVDVLFHSAAENIGVNAVGVILTGMGRDGAAGLKAIRDAGGATLGQNEASSVVYGMPRVAFEMGAVERQIPLSGVAQAILDACAAKGQQAVRI